tara:strand:- start:421 stop:708 length:288 start_codon:yes stop_codon:yes gene_type:complete
MSAAPGRCCVTGGDGTDWNELCNHPMVIFFQRIVLMLGVPALVAAAVAFVDMRDAMISTTAVLTRMEKSLDDHEKRLRGVEWAIGRHGPPDPEIR